jgi:peroxin-12
MQQNLNESDTKFTFNSNFAKPVHPLQAMSEGEIIQMDAGKCPLCHKRRENDTVLSVSGYVFCFACINQYVRQRRECPITNIPASSEQLIRLYRKSG